MKKLKLYRKKNGELYPSKLLNAFIWLVCNALVVAIIWALAIFFFESSWFLLLLIGVATVPTLTTAGLINIPIQNAGVPLFFGKRQRKWLLDEGLGWILPSPVMGVEIVSMKEQTIPIPASEEEEEKKPLIIPAIRGLPKSQHGEVTQLKQNDLEKIKFVHMKARLAIRYSIVHPFQYLSQGANVVERGLGDLAIKTLRQKGSEMSDIELIRNKDTFETDIIKAMQEEPTNGAKGAKSPLERWGVVVHNVFIPRIVHADKNIVDAYEAATQEEQQREAETIEQEFLAESIERLVNKGLNAEQALYAIQAERGKLQRREVIITSAGGAPTSDIAKAVATYIGLTGSQQPPDSTDKQNQQKEKGGNK